VIADEVGQTLFEIEWLLDTADMSRRLRYRAPVNTRPLITGRVMNGGPSFYAQRAATPPHPSSRAGSWPLSLEEGPDHVRSIRFLGRRTQ
jgi:hypothetical protein